jgi:hypothetical protein
MGFNGMTILYGHYYFHQDQVLLTHAFATSTAATTVGDGGKPRGSTELDNEWGHNCCMTNAEYRTFAHLVLGLNPTQDTIGTGNKGYKQHDCSFANMILADFVTITNLHPVIGREIAGDWRALSRALARCILLLLGSDALTPSIIQQVWGANDTIRKNLGRPLEDLALIRRRLISLSKVTINMYNLWATINFDNTRIINDDALRCHPPGLRSIIQTLKDLTTVQYVRAPLAPGTTCINILLTNLKHNTIDPSSINFEDTIVSWYSDLLLHGHTATDITDIANGIFQAFAVTHST